MPSLTRRALCGSASALVIAALAACAGQTAAQITQTALNYASTIANGVASFITTAQGIPAATVATIITYAKDAANAAGSLSSSMTQTTAQPVVQQIGADVSNVAQAVQSYVQPNSTAANILADLQLAMPLLEAAVGIVTLAGAPLNAAAAMTRLQALPKAKLPS